MTSSERKHFYSELLHLPPNNTAVSEGLRADCGAYPASHRQRMIRPLRFFFAQKTFQGIVADSLG